MGSQRHARPAAGFGAGRRRGPRSSGLSRFARAMRKPAACRPDAWRASRATVYAPPVRTPAFQARTEAGHHVRCFRSSRWAWSVRHALVDELAWAASMAASSSSLRPRGAVGPREVARHALITPGRPTIQDEHYSRRPTGAIERKSKAASATSRRSCQGPAQPRGSGPVGRSGASRAALASVGEIFTRHGR